MIEEKFGLVLIWLAVLVMICGLAFALQLPRFRAARGVGLVPAGVTAAQASAYQRAQQAQTRSAEYARLAFAAARSRCRSRRPSSR